MPIPNPRHDPLHLSMPTLSFVSCSASHSQEVSGANRQIGPTLWALLAPARAAGSGYETDSEELWPELSGEQEGLVARVVRDAIEDGFRAECGPVCRREQAAGVDFRPNQPIQLGDADDPVGHPDVGVDGVADALQ